MSKMKNWLENAAELFCEYHPNFSEELAIEYILTHENLEYWEGLKDRINETIEKCHRRISIKECDTSHAIGLALAMGQNYSYNSDYLASRILIKCENNEVLIWIAEDVDNLIVMSIPGYKKHLPFPLTYNNCMDKMFERVKSEIENIKPLDF